MRKLLAVACVGFVATVAFADPVIEFYFSKEAPSDATPYYAPAPAEWTSGTNITAAIDEVVYLWCHTEYQTSANKWNSIGLEFTGDVNAAGADPDGFYIDVPKKPGFGLHTRWQSGSDVDASDEDIDLIGVTTAAIGTYGPDGRAKFPNPGGSPADFHYCLGGMSWSNLGGKFMSVNSTLVVRSGYTTSTVYFGFDAANQPELGGPGTVVGTTSPTADIVITPEPASLVLLALAGLALRRR